MAHPLVVHCKKAAFDIYVGRPSVYGNPYSHKEDTSAKFKVATREEAIEKYEEYLRSKPGLVKLVRQELKGKILGCWCAPLACHGEVLVKVANED